MEDWEVKSQNNILWKLFRIEAQKQDIPKAYEGRLKRRILELVKKIFE